MGDMIGNILVVIGVALGVLDMILWRTVRDYRDRFILQLAVVLIGVGVLLGAHGFLIH